ncbi:hypothetical protein SLOPH_2173 [Spraguea lophii 42_110]|uniref:Uncharacterized protein n=1 Tax=Spraguea lophii (strain 42_110) TaxID=1358809 RepID=S7XT84_SPRLO|nr:hypothetical protein SLOPH_2173 [Spraguea lophii 42_110]
MINQFEEKIRIYISQLGPLITIANSYICANNIKNTGYKITISTLILPSVFCFFLPPLLANLAYTQMMVSDVLLVGFVLGLTLFMIVGHNKFLGFMADILAQFGKLGLLIAMKNNKESLSKILLWLTIAGFSSSLFLEILQGKTQFSISKNQLLDILLSTAIVAFTRKYYNKDFIIFIHVFLIKIYFVVENRFTQKNKKEKSANTTKTKEAPATPRKRPVRKAAMAAAGML